MNVNKQCPLAVRGSSQMIAMNTNNTFVQTLKNTDKMGVKRVGKKNTSFWIPIKKNKIHVTSKQKPTKNSRVTFQESMRLTLIIGQIFSLTPVIGCWSNNVEDLRFVKTSWKCFYSGFSFMGQTFMTLTCMWKIFNDTSLKSASATIFYATTIITMYMFLKVAINWPTLVQHIVKTEEADPNFDEKLSNRCNITCVVILLLALFEHILSLLLAFAAGMKCFPDDDVYQGFVKHFYPWVFNAIPYSLALGIFTQFLHIQGTFVWNFSDVFVIVISYYLTSRMEQVNRRLLTAQGKYLPEAFWKVSREDYGRITKLVRKVDDVISGVVFISFANNLFYICLQLFYSLENGIKFTEDCSDIKAKSNVSKVNIFGGYESAAYYLFSLVFLIGRSIAVSLIASQVHSASSVPAPVLYDVPSPVYCVEVQRFLDQVNGDQVALTGLKFFDVTRGLLLTIAGTIITYELVMVQFNSPSSSTGANTTTTMLPFSVSTIPTN